MGTKKKNVKSFVNDCGFMLTPQEVSHLSEVAIREKKFLDEALSLQGYEGQLSKYTNVMKGWQYRYFVINPSRATLEYYMVEEKKNSTPRGYMTLIGAQVTPSEEDSQTFSVISTCGEIYKLKATDAKDRQIWVNRLRLTIQNWENHITNSNDSLSQISSGVNSQNSKQIIPNFAFDTNLLQSLDSIAKQISIVEKAHLTLVDSINELRTTDLNLLQIKANSCSALLSLQDSLDILRAMH